jgi:acyl dehydratase
VVEDVRVEGPYFDDLSVGQRFDAAPSVTLTSGLAAIHQSVVGDRLRISLDHELSRRVAGGDQPIANPGLVWDTVIGQSTTVTQRVVANLFYRGLVLRRAARIGDTLYTSTTVSALRENTRRPGRTPTGVATLRVLAVDQRGDPVLEFTRGAMLPLRKAERASAHADPADALELGEAVTPVEQLGSSTEGWDLQEFRALVAGPHLEDLRVGTRWLLTSADVVSADPELARSSLNVAAVHHEGRAADGQRLVYGGHVIGIAMSQLTRALPSIVTVVGWHGCDHLRPVADGDLLQGTVTLESVRPRPGGGGFATLRVEVAAVPGPASGPSRAAALPVLDWRPIVVIA